jgi:hypothetical protein
VEPGAALQGTQRPPSSPGNGRGGPERPQSRRSLLGASPQGPAEIEPPGGALLVSDRAGAPVDRAGSLDHAHALERVPPWTRGETEGGSFLVGRRPPWIGPAGKPPGTAPGRGGGTWRLPAMAIVYTTGSILRTQLPASVASCQRSFRVGAAGPRPSRRTAAWRTASWRPPKHTGGRARTCGPRASDLPHPPYTAESAPR